MTRQKNNYDSNATGLHVTLNSWNLNPWEAVAEATVREVEALRFQRVSDPRFLSLEIIGLGQIFISRKDLLRVAKAFEVE